MGRASRGLDSLQNLAPRMSNTNWPGAVLAAVKTFVSAVKTDCVTSESHQRHFCGRRGLASLGRGRGEGDVRYRRHKTYLSPDTANASLRVYMPTSVVLHSGCPSGACPKHNLEDVLCFSRLRISSGVTWIRICPGVNFDEITMSYNPMSLQ